MASWAHAEIKVSNDETDVEVGFYNWGDEGFEPGETWDDLLSNLGRDGWELVQVVTELDAKTFWFKRPA